MSYTVLARKYRPQTFEDLVGQEHVTRTLGNAIVSGRIAHAFLFTGVRGVGKTTTARILSKALDCVKGPTPTPCNACDPCREITVGNDLDVLEMDGASNNSVEDVRRLQETIPYRPARDRFKVVIVDEVHMLSTGAFNAFLKTLEEPPPHVKFIFATTEIHKVPVTIRSRCQRYDFRLIPQTVVAARVREILTAESITADDAAIAMVAREAAGSMRDALTLLDQVVAFSGGELHGAEVAEALGIADRKRVFETVRAVIEGNGSATLEAVEGVAARGVDVMHFAKQVLELLRDLVVLRVAGEESALVDMVEEERVEARALVERADVLELQRAFSTLSKIVEDIGKSQTQRYVLEMGLVRVATRPRLVQIGELLARLDEIEKRAGGGGPGTASSGSRGGGSTRTPAAPAPQRSAPAETAPQRSAPAETAPQRSAPAETAPQRSAPSEIAPSASAPVASTPAPIAGPPASPPPAKVAPAPAAPPAQTQPVASEGNGQAQPSTLDVWEQIVGKLRDGKPAVAAVLAHGIAETVGAAKIVVRFPEGSFFGRQADEPDARAALAEAATPIVGAKPAIEIAFSTGAPAQGTTVAQLEQTRRDERRAETKRKALSHPRVLEAMQIFPESAGNVDVHVED